MSKTTLFLGFALGEFLYAMFLAYNGTINHTDFKEAFISILSAGAVLLIYHIFGGKQ